jgi:hypothetical protein
VTPAHGELTDLRRHDGIAWTRIDFAGFIEANAAARAKQHDSPPAKHASL